LVELAGSGGGVLAELTIFFSIRSAAPVLDKGLLLRAWMTSFSLP
jgi:hypothetical protein